MRVAGILSAKGATVATVPPLTPVAEAAGQLRLRGVGALVVSDDGRTVLGLLNERDLVRRVAERGAAALAEPVRAVMETSVLTCAPEDDIETLARMMTEHRRRHLPVLVDGQLAGIVSIGDVVKARLEELEEERRHLHDYITTGR